MKHHFCFTFLQRCVYAARLFSVNAVFAHQLAAALLIPAEVSGSSGVSCCRGPASAGPAPGSSNGLYAAQSEFAAFNDIFHIAGEMSGYPGGRSRRKRSGSTLRPSARSSAAWNHQISRAISAISGTIKARVLQRMSDLQKQIEEPGNRRCRSNRDKRRRGPAA